ncbi:MAG: putative Major facilitator superfamily transporter [Promethearchaeota archaeon]|nr:MAG: putative Major facilitator superfamily transporter [Candidatus Lokiarchaeota archaeon]
MSKNNEENNDDYSVRRAIGFSFGGFADVITYQFFTFLIFTFYYAVIGLDVNLITIGFILWSVWNALNDPFLGYISDKTTTRYGKRKIYIMIASIPLCIILVLLWTPPSSTLAAYLYFIIIIILFDTIYTMYSINVTSVFPVMFQDLDSRAKANIIRQAFAVIGLIFAFIFPSFFIPDYERSEYAPNYVITSIILAIIVGISILIFLKYGIKEREEFVQESKSSPKFFDSLKLTFKNKAFISFVIASLCNWYVFGILPTIVPLYGKFVLGIPEGQSILLSLLLGLAFISAAIFNFLWKYVSLKIGLRKGYMLSMISFILTLIPFFFLSETVGGYSAAIFAFFFLGIGLAGSLYFRDPIVSTIADQDELNTGVRREGSFYGVNALIMRLSTIFIFLTISTVFTSVGWKVFTADITEAHRTGLKLLMSLFPIIALGIGVVAINFFPITKEKYQEIKQNVNKLHKEKQQKLQRKN